MKYVPPLGAPGANDPYVNGNPGTGTPGSIVPADALEHPQREIMSVIEFAGLTPDENNLTQLLQAITTIAENLTVLIASTAEAQALTDNAKAISPLRLAESFQGDNQQISSGQVWYQKLPGNVVLIWGYTSVIAAGDDLFITLPVALQGTQHALTYNFSSLDNVTANLAGIIVSNSQIQLRNNSGAGRSAFWQLIGKY